VRQICAPIGSRDGLGIGTRSAALGHDANPTSSSQLFAQANNLDDITLNAFVT
jgi:hypothetical protein